jgi:hypothetical protein
MPMFLGKGGSARNILAVNFVLARTYSARRACAKWRMGHADRGQRHHRRRGPSCAPAASLGFLLTAEQSFESANQGAPAVLGQARFAGVNEPISFPSNCCASCAANQRNTAALPSESALVTFESGFNVLQHSHHRGASHVLIRFAVQIIGDPFRYRFGETGAG